VFDAHRQGGGGDDDLQRVVRRAEVLLNGQALVAVQVRVVEGDGRRPSVRRRSVDDTDGSPVGSAAMVSCAGGRPAAGEVVRAPDGLALGLAEDDHLLAGVDELLDQGDDPVLAGAPDVLRLDEGLELLGALAVRWPGSGSCRRVAARLVEWHGPLLAAQQARVEPALQPVGVADDR